MTKLTVSLVVLTTLLTGCPDEPGEMPDGRDGGVPDSGPVDSAVTANPVTDAAAPDAGGDRASLERDSLAQIMRCGLYEPSLGPTAYSVEDSYDACVAKCTLASPCAELKQVYCWEDSFDENAFTRCLERCDDAPADGFRCREGTLIPHAYLCDLEPDCLSGEDEMNCGQFACADGEVLSNRHTRCDYVEDCEDGSDERGCALTCAP